MKSLLTEMKQVAEAALDPNLTFFDNLNRVLHKLLDFREQHELAIKLSQEVRDIGTQMAQEGLQLIEKSVIGYIRQQVQKAIDKGEIKPCDPELTAFVMLKLYMALAADWRKTHEPLDKDRVAELLCFYLKEGLAPA
jgi:hypothetical protein